MPCTASEHSQHSPKKWTCNLHESAYREVYTCIMCHLDVQQWQDQHISTSSTSIAIICHYLPMPPMPWSFTRPEFLQAAAAAGPMSPKGDDPHVSSGKCGNAAGPFTLVEPWRAVARCKRQLHAGKLSCLWHSAQDEQLGLAWPTFFFTMEEIERDWKRLKEIERDWKRKGVKQTK